METILAYILLFVVVPYLISRAVAEHITRKEYGALKEKMDEELENFEKRHGL